MSHSLNKAFLSAIIWGFISAGAFGQEFMENGLIPSSNPQETGKQILTTDIDPSIQIDDSTQGNSLNNIISDQFPSADSLQSPEAGLLTTDNLLNNEETIIPQTNGTEINPESNLLNGSIVDSDAAFNENGYYDSNGNYFSSENHNPNGYYEQGGYYEQNGYYQNVYNPNGFYDPNSFYNNPTNGGLFSNYRTPGSRFFVDGWVATGANSNSTWPITTAAGGATNDDASSFQMNQLYLSLGLNTIKSNQISVGGRVDLLYGADYLYTSSLGLEVGTTNRAGMPVDSVYAAEPRWNRNSKGGFSQYGLAMPQAYAEVYVPTMDGLSIKMGHFYSPTGYESVMSTSNFFYTHSYSMLYGEPQTVTGLMGTQKLNANWSILGGFTQGWNVWEDPNDKMSFIAGIKWEDCCKSSSLSFTIMSGDELSGVEDSKMTNYSLVYQKQLNPCMQYVLQHDMGFADNGGYGYNANGQLERMNARWASLVNYFYWQLTDATTLGLRFEWFQDQNLSRVLSLPVYSKMPLMQNKWKGQNFYDLSLGLNWKPTPWLTVRPEVRYDWANLENVDADGEPITKGVFDDFTKKELFTVGGDVIIRF